MDMMHSARMKKNQTAPATLLLLASAAAATAVLAQAPATERNFVACPMVLDTQDIPCWVAEYEGERYFLAVQTGRSAGVTFVPQLKHEVLVEGTAHPDEPRICGGIVLSPVKLSVNEDKVIPDCGAILPGDGYHVTGPRPIGPDGDPPSGKTTAIRRAPQGPSREEAQRQFQADAAAGTTREFEVLYFFDSNYLPFPVEQATVDQAATYAAAMPNSKVLITGYRGQSNLSNGDVLVEDASLPRLRAEKVAEILKNFGIAAEQIEIAWVDEPQHNSGVLDWQKRRLVVTVSKGQ
jgi:outer membrane protein OmpA-like peptidoglycan-associated protein